MNPSVGALKRVLDGIPIGLPEFFALSPRRDQAALYADKPPVWWLMRFQGRDLIAECRPQGLANSRGGSRDREAGQKLPKRKCTRGPRSRFAAPQKVSFGLSQHRRIDPQCRSFSDTTCRSGVLFGTCPDQICESACFRTGCRIIVRGVSTSSAGLGTAVKPVALRPRLSRQAHMPSVSSTDGSPTQRRFRLSKDTDRRRILARGAQSAWFESG